MHAQVPQSDTILGGVLGEHMKLKAVMVLLLTFK